MSIDETRPDIELEEFQTGAAHYHSACCPICGNGELSVTVTTGVILVDGGTDDDKYNAGHEWDDKSPASCTRYKCPWGGTMGEAHKAYDEIYGEE